MTAAAELSWRSGAELSWLSAAAAERAVSQQATEGPLLADLSQLAADLSQLAAELCRKAALAELSVRAHSKVSLPLSPLAPPS